MSTADTRDGTREAKLSLSYAHAACAPARARAQDTTTRNGKHAMASTNVGDVEAGSND